MTHQTAGNYRIPRLHEHVEERCRDCAEKTRAPEKIGNNIECRLHRMFVRHSHHCDHFHKPGTLL